MGVWAGCLPLAVKVGGTLECPTDNGCAGCVLVGKWRIRLTF